eukprot:TRINITY_DN133_c0_g2_i1.p1 TRINITY_DN133_c0_g2~~TRINITY_DN133_c0_g2_i1.p1  ORF type:complete len:157 (-),score=52.96 TRINITY_DN133_c0_g2_i1:368-838(-)
MAESEYDPVLDVDLAAFNIDDLPTPTASKCVAEKQRAPDKIDSSRQLKRQLSVASAVDLDDPLLALTSFEHELVVASTRDLADNLEALLEDFTVHAKPDAADSRRRQSVHSVHKAASFDHDWVRAGSAVDNGRARININQLRHAFSEKDYELRALG